MELGDIQPLLLLLLLPLISLSLWCATGSLRKLRYDYQKACRSPSTSHDGPEDNKELGMECSKHDKGPLHLPIHASSRPTRAATAGAVSRRIEAMKFAGALCASLFGLYTLATAVVDGSKHVSRRQAAGADTSSVLVDFEVYKPVDFRPPSKGCDTVLLLMDYSFGYSYGHPFVGDYTPPDCDFDTVRINLTVTSRGRQFDRLALMYLNDTEVFRTSTAEPTANGIVWTYIKEMSQYLSLWKEPQKLIFDLGNLIDSTYTGFYNVTLAASFTKENNVRTADVILPISARKSAENAASAFNVPSDIAAVGLVFPQNAQRAVVSISACGQSEEEFWWSNVLNQDVNDFGSTIGALYGYSPFREIQLYIDGLLAGVAWPFPVIFTGGVAPGFWRPIVGIDAFDLREPEIDISPFLPYLLDGKTHSFEIKIAGLNTPANNDITLTETVNSYWIVTGKVFVYFADSGENIKPTGEPPRINAPPPHFTFSRNLVSDSSANQTLSYAVHGQRTLEITSDQSSWRQELSYDNYGYLNQEGLSQRNIQSTTGLSISRGTGLSGGIEEYRTSFSYPLDVNSTYILTSNVTSIDATMSRGLSIASSGGLGISTYTLTSGPVDLHTTQWGDAHYYASGGSAYSSGETTQDFAEISDGTSYNTHVQAINGTVVTPGADSHGLSPTAQHGWFSAGGRPTIRSMLGRGPN